MASLLERPLIIPKLSKLAYDMKRLGLPQEEVVKHYHGENVECILTADKCQRDGLAKLNTLVPNAKIVYRDDLTAQDVRDASLIILFGGDNHFIAVSHFIEDTPMLGVNSDPVRSHGGLLRVDEKNLKEMLDAIRAGTHRIERWERLQAVVDGIPAPPATSEYLIAERQRPTMSRHVIFDRGISEIQKGSGLLVATGAGSTGFIRKYLKESFSPGDERFVYALTEAFPLESSYRLVRGTLGKGDSLKVISRNDEEGILSVDCLTHIPVHYGAVIEFSIGKPLSVVVPQ